MGRVLSRSRRRVADSRPVIDHSPIGPAPFSSGCSSVDRLVNYLRDRTLLRSSNAIFLSHARFVSCRRECHKRRWIACSRVVKYDAVDPAASSRDLPPIIAPSATILFYLSRHVGTCVPECMRMSGRLRRARSHVSHVVFHGRCFR